MPNDIPLLFYKINWDYLLPPGAFCDAGLLGLAARGGIVALGTAGLVVARGAEGLGVLGVPGLVRGVAGLDGFLVGVTLRVLGVATLVGETALVISAGFLNVLPL